MANPKIEKLQTQLEDYKLELKSYEKDFLANDGKIDPDEQEMLDVMRGIIKEVAKKIEIKSNKKNDVAIPPAFEKGVHQLTLKIKKIQDKYDEVLKSGNLHKIKDKLLAHLEIFIHSLNKLEKFAKKLNDKTQENCKQKIESLIKKIATLKETISNDSSSKKEAIITPIAKKISTAQETLKSIMEEVARIRKKLVKTPSN